VNVVCVSHLRWDFVFQRPQHLLSRATRDGSVLYVEEPTSVTGPARIDIRKDLTGVLVAVPRLPDTLSEQVRNEVLQRLIEDAIRLHIKGAYTLWYYTPMALPFTTRLRPAMVVFDCMDELSAFAGAPAELRRLEAQLFAKADVVFTGGESLYEAKRSRHPRVHLLPSSVDVAHFAQARMLPPDPRDQALIPTPRIGYFGVIDERLDYALLAGVAAARPEWHFVLVGPTAKVDVRTLPVGPNLHYLGPKAYAELPTYISGWDVAMLPFAHNDATRFISPTKTPEYLAAGKPVVSTSIRDVVRPYGHLGLAHIADGVDAFVLAIDAARRDDPATRRQAADAFLGRISWDATWQRMRQAIAAARDLETAHIAVEPPPFISDQRLFTATAD